MALPGFELLYSTVVQQIRSSDDAAIIAVHWNLISNGLRCCGSGESWPERQNENYVGSEFLPEGWNSQEAIYALRYVDPTSNRTYLMKALAIEGSLILHLLRCFDEKTVSTTVRSRDFVNDIHPSIASTFNNLSELNTQVTKDLYTKMVERPQRRSDSESSQSHPTRSPLLEDPRRGVSGGAGYHPPRQPIRPDYSDPFSVGRTDLDPLSGGFGGGMFMDPRNLTNPGGFRPPGFPPGSIPPGARFDPVGPPGVRPVPDPDHERPPDSYDDMFM
ncbi:proteasome inhibitor PI31 subunit-like [Physella acuta]|uniref:proteasome inhibitor PI31 subunit-like n=1 Tax=Physella acuta TaxID=109671 RepID=UPI0027DD1D3B|nr:proteasome inhibitor PI31 subunit-like [Physella acuta]